MVATKLLLYIRPPELRNAFANLLRTSKLSSEEFTLELLPYNSKTSFKDVISDLQIDCIVSPGNSFGFMDGGFDAVISEYYNGVFQKLGKEDTLTHVVQSVLYEKTGGYSPVSSVQIMDITKIINCSEEIPQLLHVPTMVVPSFIPKGSLVVFDCMWNILAAVRLNNEGASRKITRVLLTGFGTGTGRVGSEECAQKMTRAYNCFTNLDNSGVPRSGLTWEKTEEIYDMMKNDAI